MVTKFKINTIWLENKLGLSINQIQSNNQIPLTPYFFWPKTNVWDQIKIELDTKTWILNSEKTTLLNSVAEIMNQWQDYANKKIEYSRKSIKE